MGIGIQVPYTSTIDRAVEHKGSHHIPVAIDILRSGDSTTSLLIVGHLVADAIVGDREVDEGHDTLVVVLHKVVVEQSEGLGERWLQARVTLRDVQRVAVICDVKQLRDAWLRGGTTVVHAQVAHLGEAIAEIERWTHIHHIANGIYMHALIILNILRLLWLNHHTEVQVILLTDESHHHLYIMIVVAIL